MKISISKQTSEAFDNDLSFVNVPENRGLHFIRRLETMIEVIMNVCYS